MIAPISVELRVWPWDLCAHCLEAFWRRCGGDSNQITGRLGETTERWFSEPEIIRTDEIIDP